MKDISFAHLFAIALLIASPLLVSVDAGDAGHEASRSLLEDTQPTDKDFESMKAADREAWAKQGGGGRKRALKATYGSAIGSSSSSSTVSSSLKVQPNGLDCLIQSSSSSTADCFDNLAFVVPACCSSISETSNTKCQSFDAASDILCDVATMPYPSCCVYRDQPKSACNTYTSDIICGTAIPGASCCGSLTCSLNVDGSDSTCSSGSSVGCCPA